MADEASFERLIARVRAGDEDAARELVRAFEPAIRRAVRLRLRDSRLRQRLDSMDVCQSVLGSFFARAALGQYELGGPEDLLKLLARMVRNKLADQANREGADKRDFRRVAGGVRDDDRAADVTPSREIAARELVDEVRGRLAEDELRLLELRQQGREWTEIAAEVGSGAEALRKKLARALDRVARELGLDEPS